MSDDLDLEQLKAEMQNAAPSPDAMRKAADLALAQKNFAALLQGSAAPARLTSKARKTGAFRGAIDMLRRFPAQATLTATTALVAVGLVVYLPELNKASDLGDLLAAGESATAAQSQAHKADGSAGQARTLSKEGLRSSEAPAISLAAPQAEMAMDYARPAPAPLLLDDEAYSETYRQANREAYPEADPNPLRVTAQDPISTFSIDVDTASYGVVRSSLVNGYLPAPDAVRIEEMVNYFPYAYEAPRQEGAPFASHVATFQTPWNSDTRIVHIGLQGRMPAMAQRPPLNLVFLIDTSGSMNQRDKLPLLKQSLALMLGELRAEDSVAIVTYAGSAGQVLAPTPASDRATILAALNALDAGGATAGQAGLQQAYALADAMRDEGEISRVLLATDGDFNVGLSDPEGLKNYIAAKRDSGTYLSVLGFGRGNLDDATMQALAQNGNGQAAYIDTLNEARKVLVDQLTGALFAIADDVKIQVEFNPVQVAEYRLIGYETRALAREDFNNDKVDAGEIGAGHSVTAMYEITPVGSPARRTDPLRYGVTPDATGPDELGFVKLRYKLPGQEVSQLIETPIHGLRQADADMRFAAAIAGFGQLLGDGKYLGDWGWDAAITLANGARGADDFGYRAEAVQLMRLAQSLAAQR